MITTTEKDNFWAIVAECLIRYYGIESTKARTKARQLRERIEPAGTSNDMLYHADPMDVASGIVGQHGSGAEMRQKAGEDYLRLLFGSGNAQDRTSSALAER